MKPELRQTELGMLPADWDVVPADDVCLKVVDCKNRTPLVVEGGDFAVVRTTNVRNGSFSSEGLRFTDEEHYKIWTARAVPQLGDVMITREAPLGEVCLVPEGYSVCLGQRMMMYRPDPTKIRPNFLLYGLLSDQVQRNLRDKLGGSTVGHAKVDDIRLLKIPVPPTINEQKAIAEALSDVDGLIAGLEALIAKKRDLKTATMQQLLTGKTRLPGFSKDWALHEFDELAQIRNQKTNTFGSGLAKNCIELEQIEAKTGRVSRFEDASGRSTSKYSFANGDVLFGRLRPYLAKYYLCDLDGVCSTEIWPLVATGTTSLFLYQLVQSKAFIDAACDAYGTHMPRADWKMLKSLRMRVPCDRSEQAAIGLVLFEMENEIAGLIKRCSKAKALKQGMMQELLTGRTRLI